MDRTTLRNATWVGGLAFSFWAWIFLRTFLGGTPNWDPHSLLGLKWGLPRNIGVIHGLYVPPKKPSIFMVAVLYPSPKTLEPVGAEVASKNTVVFTQPFLGWVPGSFGGG